MRTAYSESGRHQRRPTALVTGATSGIGLAVTRDLATDHDLILLARTATDLDELASVLGEDSGAGVRTCAVDLTDDEALAAAIGELDLADLDVLVNSAGVESSGPVEELSPTRWRDVLDLDLVSVAHLTGLLLPALRQARGLVVMINSGAGLRARPGQALYCGCEGRAQGADRRTARGGARPGASDDRLSGSGGYTHAEACASGTKPSTARRGVESPSLPGGGPHDDDVGGLHGPPGGGHARGRGRRRLVGQTRGHALTLLANPPRLLPLSRRRGSRETAKPRIGRRRRSWPGSGSDCPRPSEYGPAR